MSVYRHVNFQANETDMERIETLRKHISKSIADSHVSNTTVLRNALSIAVAHIPKDDILAGIIKPFPVKANK